MSILAKKMTATSTIPETYSGIASYLGSMHRALLERVQPHIGTDLREGKVEVSAGRMKALLSDADQACPWFSLGMSDQPRLALVQFSQSIAQAVSGARLGDIKEAGFEPEGGIGLLDLVLLQPFVADIAQGLMVLLGAEAARGDAAMAQTARHVSMAGFAELEEDDKWVRLSMPLALKEDAAKDTGLTVDVFLSAMLADVLVQAVQSASGELTVDPSDPWAPHMYGTIMSTGLPLKVIIEVLNMSVADCTRLELGQVISLPGASHKQLNVSTEVGGSLVTLAQSTLGVCKSNKAVKLLDDVDPAFVSDIGSVMAG